MNRDLMMVAGGMGLLLAGRKLSALALFARGAFGLERQWRAKHPEVAPGFQARWDASTKFYESTHQNPTNRLLHIIGIPMIVGGTAGMLLGKPFRPLWLTGAASFTAGWALNLVGHAVFEKNRPALTEDPLSFIAGPFWDIKQLRNRRQRPAADPAAS